jgi:hypothetical protein
VELEIRVSHRQVRVSDDRHPSTSLALAARVNDLIAEFAEIVYRETAVRTACLLQAHDVGLLLSEQFL